MLPFAFRRNIMNEQLKEEVSSIVNKLFDGGKSPLDKYGINGEELDRIEQENPHVSKQYPSED